LPTTRTASHYHYLTPLILYTTRRPPRSPLFPYTTLFRSQSLPAPIRRREERHRHLRQIGRALEVIVVHHLAREERLPHVLAVAQDRKSTRLNSSHDQISYAVFCLKKKKKEVSPVTSTQLF